MAARLPRRTRVPQPVVEVLRLCIVLAGAAVTSLSIGAACHIGMAVSGNDPKTVSQRARATDPASCQEPARGFVRALTCANAGS